MNFASDNTSGVSPAILQALAEANTGGATPYGGDAVTARLKTRVQDLFETAAEVFPVATGTAANALALAAMSPPWGAIYCHHDAHVNVDECGAPEFYSAGAKLIPLAGPDGKIAPETLEAALAEAKPGFVHQVQPAGLSLTNASEAGTVYRTQEVAALADLAHAHGLKVHLDGARFANAMATLGCTPAEATWKAGVDVLTLGATKNGALAAEALVVFDPALAETLAFRRKRAGHLWSKMRFLSAQLDAYLSDDLWLRNAAHANAMAARLAEGLAALPGCALQHPVEANEIFIAVPETLAQALEAAGFQFYRWQDGPSPVLRLVTAFDTGADTVTALLDTATRHTHANVG